MRVRQPPFFEQKKKQTSKWAGEILFPSTQVAVHMTEFWPPNGVAKYKVLSGTILHIPFTNWPAGYKGSSKFFGTHGNHITVIPDSSK